MSDTQTKPKRRWYQFRLRTLLIVGVLCTIPFALVGREVADAQRNEAVAEWVTTQGGRFEFEPVWFPEWIGERVWSVNLIGRPVNDLSRLAGLKDLAWLNLNLTQVSDVSPLAGLKKLSGLELRGTQVSDISPLSGLKDLERLGLIETPVTDEQVQMLQKALPNCKIER